MDTAQAEVLTRILKDMEARLATKEDLTRLEANLTWRVIAIVGFFGTVITILNAFIR